MLPLPNPPSAPLYNPSTKEYDIFEQLKNTLTKISLWELLQTSPSYNTILQNSLKQIAIPPRTSPSDVETLFQNHSLDITFHQHELSPLEFKNNMMPL